MIYEPEDALTVRKKVRAELTRRVCRAVVGAQGKFAEDVLLAGITPEIALDVYDTLREWDERLTGILPIRKAERYREVLAEELADALTNALLR